MRRLVANAMRAAFQPRLASAWIWWQMQKARQATPWVELPHGGVIGGFPSFTDYWCFQTYSEKEFQFINQAIPERGVCFDVGANIGMFSVAMARLQPHATVHAFEPFPPTFEALSRNIKANSLTKVVLHRAAVTSKPGVLKFKGELSGTQANRVAAVGEAGTEVLACTLDNVASEHGVDFIDLLKLDVEGHELEVVRGASQLLGAARIGAIFLEVIPVLLERQSADVESLLSALGESGYAVFDLQDNGTPGPKMTPAELRRREVGNYVAMHSEKYA